MLNVAKENALDLTKQTTTLLRAKGVIFFPDFSVSQAACFTSHIMSWLIKAPASLFFPGLHNCLKKIRELNDYQRGAVLTQDPNRYFQTIFKVHANIQGIIK